MARGRMPGAACLAAALIFCLFLAWAVPYSPIDDMQWGLDEPGLRWWLTGALNGRYVGNFFAVILSRSQLVKTLVMGLGLFALPLLTALLAARGEGGRFLPAFLLGGLGLLLIPPALWQEAGGWVSGFGNYGVPSALFLAWLLLLRHGAGRRGRTGLWGAALFLVTLALGLFTENLTVLMLAAGVLAAGWGLRQRRQLPLGLACLLGAVLGAALMFSGGGYRELADTGSALDGLRQLTFSPGDSLPAMAAAMLRWYLGKLLPICLLRGFHIGLPLAVVTACSFWKGPRRPLALLGLFPLACNLWVWRGGAYENPLGMALCALCWLLPLAAILTCREPWAVKGERALWLLAAPAVLAPMAAVATLGQRFYFLPTVLVVLAAADAAAPLLRGRRAALLAAGVLAVMLALPWGSRAWVTLSCTRLRAGLAQQAMETGAETLVLPTDRMGGVFWYCRNPWELYEDSYRQFWGLPEGLALVFLPPGSYETWPDTTAEQWAGGTRLGPGDN